MITSTFGSPSGRQPSADVTGEGHLNFARRLVAQERNRHIGKFKAAFVRAASGAPDELLFKDFTRRRMTLPRCPQDGGLPSACDSRKVTGQRYTANRTATCGYYCQSYSDDVAWPKKGRIGLFEPGKEITRMLRALH
jgi:hypothetical protein